MNERGSQAEDTACQTLRRAGLRLVSRNWRCRAGELDLVMCDGDTLVMIEVRARESRGHGGAAASVDAHKRRKFVRAATQFLAAHPEHRDRRVRFDVVALEGERVEWLRAAFDSQGWT